MRRSLWAFVVQPSTECLTRGQRMGLRAPEEGRRSRAGPQASSEFHLPCSPRRSCLLA